MLNFNYLKLINSFLKKLKILTKSYQKKGKENYQSVIYPNYINIVKKKNIKFSCTPFDLKSVEILKPYVDFYKIASYEMNWTPLLEACAKTKKPIILSTGMATFSEVNKAYKTIFKYNKKISLLHCVSAYPAKPISCNLNSIKYLKKKFKCAIGWSDHTVNPIIIYNVIKSQKADIIELHFDLEGLGWEEKEGNHHCWLPEELKKLLNYIKMENVINGKFKKNFSNEEKMERKFRTDPTDGLRPLKKFRKQL